MYLLLENTVEFNKVDHIIKDLMLEAERMQQSNEQWIEQLLKMNDDVKMTEKQSRIIQAAVEIFSEKGYAASSTSEIAQKAGVAEGTIFRHYKTKKDLLMS